MLMQSEEHPANSIVVAALGAGRELIVQSAKIIRLIGWTHVTANLGLMFMPRSGHQRLHWMLEDCECDPVHLDLRLIAPTGNVSPQMTT